MEFGGWIKAHTLDLSGHSITVLRNRAFRGIIPKRILLQNNNISIIERNAFVDVAIVIEELDLSSNDLVQLPQGLDKLVALKTLKLAGNTKLKLERGSFRGLASLETLDLHGCYMNTLPDGTFDGIKGTLRKLDIIFNELESIPTAIRQLRNLEEVDFDSNPLSYVPAKAFRGMNKLKKLTLSRHDFSKPDSIHPLAFVDVAPTLENLDFYHSDITVYPAKALAPLKKLKSLSFNSNNIHTFPPKAFQPLDSLEELTLDGNIFEFSREMFDGITDTLTMLSIRDMRLTELPLHELAVLDNLQWLDASSNDFTSLPDNFTQGLHARRYTLNWMNIADVSPLAFVWNNGPVHVSLNDNKMKSLSFITDPCMYDYVGVTENPLVCDCYVFNIALSHYVQVEATCAAPPLYAKMNVEDVASTERARRKCGNMRTKTCPKRDKLYYHYNSSSRAVLREHSVILSLTTLLIGQCIFTL
ncbi:leucine-rich repeat-containing G-protein coupled receptor 5-like [Liolophura sinensis]|uniref:leucine-rich repeat-containing G-protein coupled receptor 5-like n=1 Tax=Liolophura sinensis TaxID=3198878 RepID=UPI003158F32E